MEPGHSLLLSVATFAGPIFGGELVHHRGRPRSRPLGAVLAALRLAWSAPAGAQTSVSPPSVSPLSPLSPPRPEPKEQLLTPSEPTPAGDIPLLKLHLLVLLQSPQPR